MIIIRKFKKLIPSFRWKKINYIYDNSYFLKNKNKMVKKDNLIKRKKRFYFKQSISVNKSIIKFFNLITQKYIYQQKPYKKFIVCSTINNFTLNLPGIDKLNVGKVMYTYKLIKLYKKLIFFKGILCYLKDIPLVGIFSNVTNVCGNKLTYSKAGGTFCKTKKAKKSKHKLILVILPSKKEVYLNNMSKAYLGKNTNYKVNKLVEGKWGFSFSKSKKISVRGVAMNPVDHPNGGRAKTVQPERSPWNWVAKKKK